jgi:hypothetical protein
MKFLNICFLILVFHTGLFQANSQNLSSYARISLLTCNPGNELYSVFGHSAIRVHDVEKGIDWVYNYGTFNFAQPGFYVKFVRGHLNYQLSVYHMRDFMNEYQSENRSVYEQVLDLSPEQKELVFSFIEFNRLPENKFYLYDFFFDNCATRIRDVFQNELKNQVKFDSASFKNLTFREMLKPYLEPHPWSRFGINLVLGAIADRKANLQESMFLPDYMNMAFENASVVAIDTSKAFVRESLTLFEQKSIENKNSFFAGPEFVLSALLIIILIFTFLEFRAKIRYKIIDFIVFFSVGLIGMILFFLWFFTDHTAVVKNWNLLWAVPAHLVLAFFVFRKTKSTFLKYYFLVTGLAAFCVLPLWTVIPQCFDLAFIPLIILLSVRSMQMFLYHR